MVKPRLSFWNPSSVKSLTWTSLQVEISQFLPDADVDVEVLFYDSFTPELWNFMKSNFITVIEAQSFSQWKISWANKHTEMWKSS